jgi:hypothetical protein
MKFIVLDTKRALGLKHRQHSQIGFWVVRIFEQGKGELVWGGLSLFSKTDFFLPAESDGLQVALFGEIPFTSVPRASWGTQVQAVFSLSR